MSKPPPIPPVEPSAPGCPGASARMGQRKKLLWLLLVAVAVGAALSAAADILLDRALYQGYHKPLPANQR